MSQMLVGGAMVVVLLSSTASAQTCPPTVIVSNTADRAQISVEYESPPTCVVPEKGYVKTSRLYKLHVIARTRTTGGNEGSCQVYSQTASCPPVFVQNRHIGYTYFYDNGSSSSFTSSSRYYDYDTHISGQAAPANFSTTVIGQHVITSTTNALVTSCGFVPTPFPEVQPVTFYALACAPAWETDTNSNYANLSNAQIQIYVSVSGLITATDAAINSWNDALGFEKFVRVSNDCGTGAECARVLDGAIGDCAGSSYSTDANGQINGNAIVTVNSNWNTYGTHVPRLIAHELGHLLGLDDHQTCTGEQSVMRDGLACNSSISSIVTQNNSIPVNNTIYGVGSRVSCGFF